MSKESYNIIIIDDDQMLLDIYSVKFKEKGHNVDVALGAQEALKKMKSNDFDAMLLDIIMPNMDGLELLQELDKEKLATNTVRLILSNQGDKEDIAHAQKFNIDGYIVKANTIPSEVLEMVTELVKKKRQ